MSEEQSPPPQLPPPRAFPPARSGPPPDPSGQPMWSNQTPTEAIAAAYAPRSAPPGRPGRPSRRAVLGVAAVVLALVAGTGTWLVVSGSDGDGRAGAASTAAESPGGNRGADRPSTAPGDAAKPTSPPSVAPPRSDPNAAPTVDLVPRWSLPGTGDRQPTGHDPRGGWVTDTRVFVVRKSGITMYDAAGGYELGAVPLPAPDAVICSALARPVGGIGLVGWAAGGQSTDGCVAVTAVDLATGTALWTEKVEGHAQTYLALSAAGDLGVVGTDDTVFGFDLRAGTRLWRWKSPPTGDGQQLWLVQDVLASTRHVAVTMHRHDTAAVFVGGVALIDAASGATRSEVTLANGPDSWPRLLSASPVVVYDQVNATGRRGVGGEVIAVYDDALGLRAKLAGVGGDGIVFEESDLGGVGPNSLDGAVAVFGDTLYATLGTTPTDQTTDEVTGQAVAAYDLGTGKPLWTVSTGVPGNADPISADDTGVTFIAGDRANRGEQRIVHLAAADGVVSTVYTLRGDGVTWDPAGFTTVVGDRVAVFTLGLDQPVVQVFGRP